MIFRNNIIFNEAKKPKKSSKRKNKEDIDIKELRANVKRANDAMSSIIGDDYEDDPEEYEMDDEIVSDTDRRLRDYDDEDYDEEDEYEDENDEEQLGNADYDEESEDDYEEDDEYEDQDNYSLDDYEDDSEDLEDIEDQIDYANNNEYEDNYDGDFNYMDYDGDEDLDNIEADVEAANDYDGEYEYEQEEPEEEQPQQPVKNSKPKVKERDAEMDPMVTGGVATLPTDGLDDDEEGDDLDNIESQVDAASNGADPNSANLDGEGGGEDPTLTDPNLDSTDPVYDDDSDPLAGIDDPEEKESERIKKIVLLKQYKELISIITDFKITVENLQNSIEYEDDENITYILEQLKSMKDKIMFTVEQKFLDAKYTDLLKIYYYFKFGLNSTSKFMEKLINSKQNNKQ